MIILNPGKQKNYALARRASAKSTRRKGRTKGQRRAARITRRRSFAAKRSYRHRLAGIRGAAARTAVSKIACSAHPYRTIHRLRKRCDFGATLRPMISSMRSLGANPASVLKSATAGFRPAAIKQALPLAVGALVNTYLTPYIASKLPGNLNTGWKRPLLGLGVAGLSLMVPRYGQSLFVGGVTGVLISLGLPLAQRAFARPAPLPRPAPVVAAAGVRGIGDLPVVEELD